MNSPVRTRGLPLDEEPPIRQTATAVGSQQRPGHRESLSAPVAIKNGHGLPLPASPGIAEVEEGGAPSVPPQYCLSLS